MKVCGYTRQGRAVIGLKELTLVCTEEELTAVIQFLSLGKKLLCEENPEKSGFIPINGRYCIEMRDWDKKWSKDNPAVILYVESNKAP